MIEEIKISAIFYNEESKMIAVLTNKRDLNVIFKRKTYSENPNDLAPFPNSSSF